MPLSTDQINKPIFVVGSPRSGTSILTWCLGQHPSMLVLPESVWMGDFAIDLAIRYQIGTARGNRSVLSAMDIEREEFFARFGQSINDLILNHRKDLERKRSGFAARAVPNAVPEASMTVPPGVNRKARWVDGTPEYSLHICGLRKLFPKALFIHIVRDVTSVVRSMLNFHRVAGSSLVANEQEAYNYWLRTVSSCLLAERAYGPRVVFRLRYSDFVDTPEAALRSLLNFLSEPFAAECLTPLQKRINSSNVPVDFKIGDPENPSLVEQAMRLSTEVEKTPQPPEASPAASDEMEAAFNERVQYVATLDREYHRAKRIITTLQKENAERTKHRSRLKIPLAERLEGWSTRWREVAVFVFFGAVRTALGYGSYLLLVLFFAYSTAYTVSYVAGVFIAYYLNARFVFGEKLRLSKALQFPIVYLAQYLIGLGSLYLLIEVAQVSKFFAPLVVVVITIPCTYLLSRYVIKGVSRTSRRP